MTHSTSYQTKNSKRFPAITGEFLKLSLIPIAVLSIKFIAKRLENPGEASRSIPRVVTATVPTVSHPRCAKHVLLVKPDASYPPKDK